MEHEILLDQLVDGQDIAKTTHPKVIYDILTELFIVDIGDDTICEVWGRNRFKKAIEIADKFSA